MRLLVLLAPAFRRRRGEQLYRKDDYPNYKIEAGNKYFAELKALLDGRFADDTAKLKQLLPGKDIDRLWGGAVARPGQRKSWQTMSI